MPFIKDATPQAFAKKALKAGQRAAYGQVKQQNNDRAISLYQLMEGTQHQVLLLVNTYNNKKNIAICDQINTYLRQKYKEVVRVHVISYNRLAFTTYNGSLSFCLDIDGQVHQNYGVEPTQTALYLIRPDMYIAFRSSPINLESLQAYLHDFFVQK